MATKGRVRRFRARNWVLAGVCWYALWATSRPGWGQPLPNPIEEKRPPQAWLQRYLGLEFPNSARHFALHYRSGDEDVVLFSFDVSQDDLVSLLDGRGIFPHFAELTSGGADPPKQVAGSPGAEDLLRKATTLPHALSATKSQADRTERWEVRLWTGRTPAGPWEVCIAMVADKQVDKAHAPGGFRVPPAARDRRSYVIINSRRPRHGYGTSIWQRWALAEADYREFLASMEGRHDVDRLSGVTAQRRVAALTKRTPTPSASWWNPAELKGSHAGGSEPVQSLAYTGPDDMTAVLVAARADSLFLCYAYTQRNILAPDPWDAIPHLLGLPLPEDAHEAHYESASNMAGIVFWMRFDLSRHDWQTCLARTSTLPPYGQFAPDTALKKFLETGYHTGAPPWWRPEELQEGIYAQRRTNTKDLSDVSVGFGRLGADTVRVYIGAFSPW